MIVPPSSRLVALTEEQVPAAAAALGARHPNVLSPPQTHTPLQTDPSWILVQGLSRSAHYYIYL